MFGQNLDIAEFIREHKRAVESTLAENGAFHEAFNDKNHQALDGKNKLSAQGFIPDRPPYSPDAHEVLLWTDPEAYVEELNYYSEDAERGKHQEVLQYLTDSGQRTEFKSLVKAIGR